MAPAWAGYAALRFADAAGANACLALSPQYTNNPAIAPWERRWEQDATTIPWREEIDAVLRCGCRPVVVYDPSGPDRRHAASIAAAVPVAAIPIRHAGHPVATYLAAAGLLEPLCWRRLTARSTRAAFAVEARRRRAGNAVYRSELARLQPAHRRRLAIALARGTVAAEPGNDLAVHTLAMLLTAAGKHGEALPLHALAVERSGGFLAYVTARCEALVAADDRRGALAAARAMVAAHGDYAHVHSLFAHVLWRNRRFDEALAAARRAAAMVPANAHYADVVALYEFRRRPATLLRKLARRLLGLPPPSERRARRRPDRRTAPPARASGSCHWRCGQGIVDEADRDRHLERGQPLAHPGLQLRLSGAGAGRQVNDRRRLLAQRAVGHADHRRVGHRGMA